MFWQKKSYKIAHSLNTMALLLFCTSGNSDSLWFQRIIATHQQSTVAGIVHACRARAQRGEVTAPTCRKHECRLVKLTLPLSIQIKSEMPQQLTYLSYFMNTPYPATRVFICIYLQAGKQTGQPQPLGTGARVTKVSVNT